MIGRLLCAFGRHAPDPDGLWNGGYCFTQCRRCGQDMVRSAFGEWHIPRDHRIVWRPPADGHAHRFDIEAPSPPEPPRTRRPMPHRTGRRDPFDFGEFDDAAQSDNPATPNLRALR